MKPRLLDLFCGAGGAAMGYHRAGFDVVGVDIKPQPNYPFPIVVDDALKWFEEWVLSGHDIFDAIHASPPCQAHVQGLRAMNSVIGRSNEHRDVIGSTRELLLELGLPWVIENVVGSPLRSPVRLCGSSFGLPLHRHRFFDSVSLLTPPCSHSWQHEQKYWNGDRSVRNADGTRSYTGHSRLSSVVQIYGHAGGREIWPEALGIDWMTAEEMIEAIPPVYTEVIGSQLLAYVPAT